MAFDLQIEFVGLCLFVPGPENLYVLMPAAGVAEGTRLLPLHVSTLVVDTAYLQPQSTRTNGIAALATLDGTELTFAGAGPPDTDSLPDVLARVPNQIDRTLLGGDLGGGRLNARVKLGLGTCTEVGATMCWVYPHLDNRQMLTTTLTWTISGFDTDELDLNPLLSRLTGQTTAPIPLLYPIGDTIQVSIYNTTPSELPPNPQLSQPPLRFTPALHFTAYHILFDPANEPPIPLFYGGNCSDGSGAVPYTCMGPALTPPIF